MKDTQQKTSYSVRGSGAWGGQWLGWKRDSVKWRVSIKRLSGGKNKMARLSGLGILTKRSGTRVEWGSYSGEAKEVLGPDRQLQSCLGDPLKERKQVTFSQSLLNVGSAKTLKGRQYDERKGWPGVKCLTEKCLLS